MAKTKYGCAWGGAKQLKGHGARHKVVLVGFAGKFNSFRWERWTGGGEEAVPRWPVFLRPARLGAVDASSGAERFSRKRSRH